jgi:hypothetical protein
LLSDFQIEGTRKTPSVILKPEGIIKIEGRSIPEDSNMFFQDVWKWILEYVEVPQANTIVDISLEYLNSGTSKFVLQLLKKLKDCARDGCNLNVNWYYEEGDDDILERGEYFSNILELKINLIEIE